MKKLNEIQNYFASLEGEMTAEQSRLMCGEEVNDVGGQLNTGCHIPINSIKCPDSLCPPIIPANTACPNVEQNCRNYIQEFCTPTNLPANCYIELNAIPRCGL